MNLDWDDATKTYNLTKKAVDDRENFQLKQELKGIGKQTVEKTQAYSPDQIAGLTDQAEKDGGEWIEADQNYKMPDGSRRIATNTPTWENGAYQNSNGEVVAPKAQYSFGGQTRDTDFTPDEVKGLKMQSRADVYRNYGRDTEADQLESAGLQRRAAMQAINKGDLEAEREKNWKTYDATAGKLSSKFAEVEKQVDKMLKAGDNIGASRLMAQFRTDEIPDSRAIFVNQDGVLTGVDTDGTTKQSDLNAHNPNVAAKMRDELKGSIAEHLKSLRPSMGYERDYQFGRDNIKDGQWTTDHNDTKAHNEKVFTAGREDQAALVQHQKDVLKQAADLFDKGEFNAGKRQAAGFAHTESMQRLQNSATLAAAKLTKGIYGTVAPFGVTSDGKVLYQSSKEGIGTIDAKGEFTTIEKYDAAGTTRFALEAKDNTKAQEDFRKFVTENPDATAEQKSAMRRDFGLDPALDFSKAPSFAPSPQGLVKPKTAFGVNGVDSGSVFAGKRVVDNNVVPDSRLGLDRFTGQQYKQPILP